MPRQRGILDVYVKKALLTHPFLLSSLVVMLLLAAPALAQNPNEPKYQFEIAAQPLSAALIEFNHVTGQQVAADSSAIKHIESNAVSGELTAREALKEMISGRPLEWVQVNGNNFALRSISSPMPPPRAASVQEEIIIFGTKQGVSLQNTIESVALFTERDMFDQALFEAQDIPALTANVTNTVGLFNIAIRGINSRGFGGSGAGRTSNVYIDGAPASINGLSGAFNLWDVEQVEILRGPQSTTQGRNALAGAMVIKTSDPEYEFNGKVMGIVGSEDTRQASAMLTGPLIDNQVAYRLALDYREQDFNGFNVPVGVSTDASDATTARGKLLIEPDAIQDLRVELNLQYTDYLNSGRGNSVIGPNAGTPEAIGFDPFDLDDYDFRAGEGKNEATRFITDVSYRFSDRWRTVLVATYDDTKRLINNN
ncbi:MAG: TonB-dependent receptor, partial [Pseudomonadota bacterium]